MNPAELPLRGMQMPQDIGIWPLAFGWWVLIALCILLPLAFIQLRRWQQQRLSSVSLKQLAQLRTLFEQTGDANGLAVQLSMLTRQVVLSLYPRENVASVTGEKWLALLDRLGNTDGFLQGAGRQLLTAQYRNQPIEQAELLFELMEQ